MLSLMVHDKRRNGWVGWSGCWHAFGLNVCIHLFVHVLCPAVGVVFRIGLSLSVRPSKKRSFFAREDGWVGMGWGKM